MSLPDSVELPIPGDWELPSATELHRMLPQYDIVDILGRGGMGAVFKGRQAALGRDVAIKLLCNSAVRSNAEMNFIGRFKQEARVMAKFDHPAIISIFDFGETSDGQLYLVMEFVDGMDIHKYMLLHGGKLPQEYALSITAHVLDGLEYAHSHGIIHRDIKPANILLNKDGKVKIADFGLMKKVGGEAEDTSLAAGTTGFAVGTPHFLAPEAHDSKNAIDHRADLYSMGVMLYQMLTGILPQGSFKPPSKLCPELDVRLDRVIENAMAQDPDHRYASATDMRADIDQIVSQPVEHIESGAADMDVPIAVPVFNLPASNGAGREVYRPAVKEQKFSKTILYVSAGLMVLLGLVVYAALYVKDEMSDASDGSITDIQSFESENIPKISVEKKEGGIADTIASEGEAMVPVSVEPAVEVKTPDSAKTPLVVDSKANPESMTGTAGNAIEKEAVKELVPVDSSIANIPEVKMWLERYVGEQRESVGELAKRYENGLNSRQNKAADAGKLELVNSFREEKKRLSGLVEGLTAEAEDLAQMVRKGVTLSDLPEGTPQILIELRQNWHLERKKIQSPLDDAMQQSLRKVESKLTKARDFDNAERIQVYRKSLPGIDNVIHSENVPTNPGRIWLSVVPVNATKDKPFENSLGMRFVPVKVKSLPGSRKKCFLVYGKLG